MGILCAYMSECLLAYVSVCIRVLHGVLVHVCRVSCVSLGSRPYPLHARFSYV